MRTFFIFIVIFISNFFRAIGLRACRFYPSCSRYSTDAFRRLPVHRALVKSAWRVLRCHPFASGGHDPL